MLYRRSVGPVLLLLASRAAADRYIECDPDVQSCGDGGSILLLLAGGALVLGLVIGAAYLFVLGPGALWNRILGRDWDDSQGMDAWITTVGIVIPSLTVAAIPALIGVGILDRIFGPFGFTPYAIGVAAWWWYLVRWFKRSANEARSEATSDKASSHPTNAPATPATATLKRQTLTSIGTKIREVDARAVHDRAPIDLGRPVGAARWMPEPKFVAGQPHIAGVIVVELAPDVAYLALYGASLKATCRDFTAWWREHMDKPPGGWADLIARCDLESALVVESEYRFPSSLRSSAELLLANRRRRGAECAVWGSPNDYTAPSR